MVKRALVCGAGGFIGGHLVKKLKREGYWVRGVDIKEHQFAETQADEFLLLDLREPQDCWRALTFNPSRDGRCLDPHPEPRGELVEPSPEGPPDGSRPVRHPERRPEPVACTEPSRSEGPVEGSTFDEVYQLAADMGGMGFIHSAECDIMRNSALINIHMIDAATRVGVGRYFFSSSVCVYRDMEPGEPALDEGDAYPAMPDNEYGWEKLYAERMALAYARHYPIQVRVARFQNCYGPEGTWRGGREKAPAAICRKVAMAEDGGTIPVWGDGAAVRAYTYVDDLVDGVFILMQSDLEGPTIIGGDEYVTVDELVQTVIDASGKEIHVQHVEGPVGVHARNFDKSRIKTLGWEATTRLKEGIAKTYKWIEKQVEKTNDE